MKLSKFAIFLIFIAIFISFISGGAILLSAASTIINILGVVAIAGGFYFFIIGLMTFKEYVKENITNQNLNKNE